MSLWSKIFGDANGRYVASLQPAVDQINALESSIKNLSDDQLKIKTAELKKNLADGKTLDDILPEAFALVREASRRVSGKRHFDVQLMGGIALHQGKIAEMRTGEGKTLVATLPAYLNALTGKGVHIITVNDYLARRDATWMGEIYNALGLSVGCINHDASYLYDATHQNSADPLDQIRDQEGSFRVVHEFLRPVERGDAYQADITYGTNNEYGFDYLRDNLIYGPKQLVQRQNHGHNFAIVDEVDSILIDEARTPLIISAPDTDSAQLYKTFSAIAPHLIENEDYNLDEKMHAVSITESGIEKVERQLGISNIYDEGGVQYVHHLEQALKAQVLFKRDKNYVVKDGQVVIVDEFTGRLMPGRRWSEGLHQAMEAKEGVKVEQESKTLASITFQNYFRLYGKLAGMTGTAKSSAEEFHRVYDLTVVEIPTHQPMIRADNTDRIYKNEQGKFKAIVNEIKERHERRQPVLVGTASIDKNELLGQYLEREGIPFQMLNAKNHEREGEIIAQAGKIGAVTVATNMAGRGVDIILGGTPINDLEANQVRELGGLHVIGTERHEARRIDDQLRGRAGRQGDPGSSQFFISVEDEVVRVFGGDRLKNMMERLGVTEDDVIENSFVASAIQQAQSRIEGQNFDTRKYVLEYDDVVNKHRSVIYTLRRTVLTTPSSEDLILDYVNEYITDMINFHSRSQDGGWNTKEIWESLKTIAPFAGDFQAKLNETIESAGQNTETVTEFVFDELTRIYEVKEVEITEPAMRELERAVLLRVIDELWMEHLATMEHLRDSVRLRAYGQRDPLVEYKIEAQKLFDQLMHSLKAQVVNTIYKVSMTQPRQRQATSLRLQGSESSQSQSSDRVVPVSSSHEPGRNDPCPCGSGKKYKKCHGK